MHADGQYCLSSMTRRVLFTVRSSFSLSPLLLSSGGTRMYSSPEQTRRSGKIDGRSDVWGCGVILYQMLSLLVDVPFDPIELVLHPGTSVPSLSLHCVTPGVSDQLIGIVMTSLSFDREHRYATAMAMWEALHREELRIMTPPGEDKPMATTTPVSRRERESTDGFSSYERRRSKL